MLELFKKLAYCFSKKHREDCDYYDFLEKNIDLLKFDADFNALD